MSENETSITKTPDIFKPKRSTSLAARRAQVEQKLKEINPLECPHRLGLIFDDSGSMTGEPLKNAKTAVQNFTNSCNPLETSIALYPMNGIKRSLTIDYTSLNILVMGIDDRNLGGTPLYNALDQLLIHEDITRGVIFSDGSPTDSNYHNTAGQEDLNCRTLTMKEFTIQRAKTKQIPVDTIYIGDGGTPDNRPDGYKEMQWIAEQTGGLFIHFSDSASLNKSLKYLSPALRPLLANAELKAKIEKGGTI